jgi:hypothetical protein
MVAAWTDLIVALCAGPHGARAQDVAVTLGQPVDNIASRMSKLLQSGHVVAVKLRERRSQQFFADRGMAEAWIREQHPDATLRTHDRQAEVLRRYGERLGAAMAELREALELFMQAALGASEARSPQPPVRAPRVQRQPRQVGTDANSAGW